MEQVVLEATPRIAGGKGAARATRREGLIPGVAYGLGHEPINLSVSRDSLLKALKAASGGNVLFDLQVTDVERPADAAALVKGIQIHPVTRIPESVDFQWVSLAEVIQVSVQVVMEGSSPAIKEGAVLDLLLHEVEVECLPVTIPQRLVVNVEGIGFHETRTVADLAIPPGVVVLTDPDALLVACVLPSSNVGDRAEDEVVADEIASVDEV